MILRHLAVRRAPALARKPLQRRWLSTPFDALPTDTTTTPADAPAPSPYEEQLRAEYQSGVGLVDPQRPDAASSHASSALLANVAE
ncbi:hypothetical protein N0V95_009966, partial [Ascochyta clinopodiicola]